MSDDLTTTPEYDEAQREAWARRTVARAGKSWLTHTAKFTGAVVQRDNLDPALIATVARLEAEAVDWSAYRACYAVCRAPIGEPCVSQSGHVVGGRPDGARTPLPRPHVSRKLRVKRTKR
jgi:hypothetical protein